jgi:hypothetical protein
MSLPAGVTAFLRERISSLSELELLLLLHRDTDRPWTAANASDTLKLAPAWVAVQLERLVVSGFAQRIGDAPPSYRWHLADPDLAATVERVASAYKARRTRVITSIYSGVGQ